MNKKVMQKTMQKLCNLLERHSRCYHLHMFHLHSSFTSITKVLMSVHTQTHLQLVHQQQITWWLYTRNVFVEPRSTSALLDFVLVSYRLPIAHELTCLNRPFLNLLNLKRVNISELYRPHQRKSRKLQSYRTAIDHSQTCKKSHLRFEPHMITLLQDTTPGYYACLIALESAKPTFQLATWWMTWHVPIEIQNKCLSSAMSRHYAERASYESS